MELLIFATLPFLGAVVGYVICLFQKGIVIHVKEPASDLKEGEYLPDTSNMLPPEVKQYLDKTQGQMDY